MVARTRPAAGGRVTDEVLDVRRLVRGVLRRWALVLGLGLAGLLAGAVHADGQPRVFVSQSRVLLLPSGLDSAGHPLRDIDTETFVATSSDILGQAGATFRPPRTAAQLRGMVGARSASPNILEVQAASVIPHEARTVADAVARAYVAYTNNPNANDAQMAAPRAQADALSARIRQLEEQIATQQAGLVGTDPTSPDAARGAALLDALHSEEVDSQRTLDTLNSRLGDTVLNAQAQSPGARILDPALEPGRPVSPHPLREMGEGTLGGLGGGLLLALGLERLDRRLRRRDDIARAVGAPVLCSLTVPRRLRARDSCRYVLERWRPSVVEVLALERVLHRADGSEPPENLVVVSSARDRRAPIAALQLAVRAAATERRTALVVATDAPPSGVLRSVHEVAAAAHGPVRARLWMHVSGELGKRELTRAKLLVVAVASRGGSVLLPTWDRRTVVLLATSAGSVTAPTLTAIAAACLEAGYAIEGVLVVNPDPRDPTPGRLSTAIAAPVAPPPRHDGSMTAGPSPARSAGR